MAFRKADFEVSKTPAASALLSLSAKKAVNDAARESKSIRDLAAAAQLRMEQANGTGWHVAVGTDFAVDLRYRKGACILLSSRGSDTKVLLYRTTPALSTLPKADHEALLPPAADASKPEPTERKLKQRVAVNDCDMDADMRARVQEAAKRLLERYVGDADMESKVAKALKHSLTFHYGHTWHVIVSSSREFCCLPHFVPGSRVDLSVDKYRVVAYQHASAALDRRMDLTRLGNNLALLLALAALVVYGYLLLTASELDRKCVTSKDAQGNFVMAVGCRIADVHQANARASWKGMALFGGVFFTVAASALRIFRNTLRQRAKQA